MFYICVSNDYAKIKQIDGLFNSSLVCGRELNANRLSIDRGQRSLTSLQCFYGEAGVTVTQAADSDTCSTVPYTSLHGKLSTLAQTNDPFRP